MSDLVLYQYPGNSALPSLSPPCAKVHLALRLLELPHSVVDLRTPQQVRKVSPTGRVPALARGETVRTDSIRIMDWLEELDGSGRLAPEDPVQRAQDRVWEHFANDALYWQLVYLRWLVPAHRAAMALKMARGSALGAWFVERLGGREARRRCVGQGIGLKSEGEVLDDLQRALQVAVDGLGSGPYLGGRQRPGRGDLGLAAAVSEFGWAELMPSAQERVRAQPALGAHVVRVFRACGFEPPPWCA